MIDYKKTITNIHKLLPELDLDTLFKIMEAIVEKITPAYNCPSGVRTPSLDKYWTNIGGQDQMESLVNVTTKNR